MKNQGAHFLPECPSEQARVSPGHRWGNGDITDVLWVSRRARKSGRSHQMAPSCRLPLPLRRKRKYIGGRGFTAIGAIPARDSSVRHQADGHGVGGQSQLPLRARQEFPELLYGDSNSTLAIQDHRVGSIHTRQAFVRPASGPEPSSPIALSAGMARRVSAGRHVLRTLCGGLPL